LSLSLSDPLPSAIFAFTGVPGLTAVTGRTPAGSGGGALRAVSGNAAAAAAAPAPVGVKLPAPVGVCGALNGELGALSLPAIPAAGSPPRMVALFAL